MKKPQQTYYQNRRMGVLGQKQSHSKENGNQNHLFAPKFNSLVRPNMQQNDGAGMAHQNQPGIQNIRVNASLEQQVFSQDIKKHAQQKFDSNLDKKGSTFTLFNQQASHFKKNIRVARQPKYNLKNNMKYRVKNYQPQLRGDNADVGLLERPQDLISESEAKKNPEENFVFHNPFKLAKNELETPKVHDKTLSEFDEFDKEIHQRVNYMCSLTEGNERKTVRFNLVRKERSFSQSDIHELQLDSDSLSSKSFNSSEDCEIAEEQPRSSSLFGSGQKSTATSCSGVTTEENKENIIRYERTGDQIKIQQKLQQQGNTIFSRDYFVKYGDVRSYENVNKPLHAEDIGYQTFFISFWSENNAADCELALKTIGQKGIHQCSKVRRRNMIGRKLSRYQVLTLGGTRKRQPSHSPKSPSLQDSPASDNEDLVNAHLTLNLLKMKYRIPTEGDETLTNDGKEFFSRNVLSCSKKQAVNSSMEHLEFDQKVKSRKSQPELPSFLLDVLSDDDNAGIWQEQNQETAMQQDSYQKFEEEEIKIYDPLPPLLNIPTFGQQCSYGMSLSDPTGLGISDLLTGNQRQTTPYLMMNQHQGNLAPLEELTYSSTLSKDNEFISMQQDMHRISPRSQQKPQNKEYFKVDLDRISHGLDHRTTVMIKNIPNKYTEEMLIERIDQGLGNGNGHDHDFFYLPIDGKNHCNVGYAFINFVDARSILALHLDMNGTRWTRFNSEKVCEITYARVQGKANLVNFQHKQLSIAQQTEARRKFQPNNQSYYKGQRQQNRY